MPKGFKASGDIYICSYENLISHIQNQIKIVDSALLHCIGMEQNFWDTWDLFTIQLYSCWCPQVPILFPRFLFGGLNITSDGIPQSESYWKFSSPNSFN